MIASRFIVFAILTMIVAAATPAPGQPNRVDALLATDQALESAYAAKNIGAALAFFAPDASVLGANAPVLSGRAAIRKSLAGTFGLPRVAISWHADKFEVAKSGDLGYTSGKNRISFSSNRKTMLLIGKYVTVWKKQADGTWKVILDIYNADAPS